MSLSGSAAKVGGDKVTLQEFQRAYNSMKERLQAQYQEAFDPIAMQLPKYVMRQLVDERVTYQAAVNAGIEARDEDVVSMLKDAKAFQDENGRFNKEPFERYLRQSGYTEASFTAEYRRSITAQNFRQFVSKSAFIADRSAALQYRLNETKVDLDYVKLDSSMIKLSISNEEITKFLDDAGKDKVKSYYDSHPNEFNTKERAKARHILVSFTGARSASGKGALRTKDAAKKEAERILGEVNASGADFGKLASTYTDEASGKTKGGDLGFFGRDDMVKEFSETAFAMKPGQISGVVESPFGFHIIKLEELQVAKTTTLEEATNEIATKLVKETKTPELLKAKADELLAQLISGKSIDADIKALGSSWQSTGPVNPGSGSLGALGGDQSTIDAVLKLSKAGDIVPTVIDNLGAKYIAKLKSKEVPDESKLDDKKRRELAEAAASNVGYSLISIYEKALRKELEEKGKIWENPEYLSLGMGKGNDQDTGG
jgi:peptidyl-prolyl cis-trans isomerase D